MDEAIQDIAEFVTEARRIVVLSGAGISTESGIPDFRSENGIWQTYPPVDYREFMTSSEARQQYWALRRALHQRVMAARPNPAHRAVAALERQGKLAGVITQNFDGLHQEAGNAPEHVVELHGTSRLAACQTCDARFPMAEVQARYDAGDHDPRCGRCNGYLKAATILFGQRIPPAELAQAMELARAGDLFLVVGSSLRVNPAARLPGLALAHGAPLVIINLEPTPYDGHADVVLQARAGEALPRVLAAAQLWSTGWASGN
jgi:NAD-dependent deacetylase